MTTSGVVGSLDTTTASARVDPLVMVGRHAGVSPGGPGRWVTQCGGIPNFLVVEADALAVRRMSRLRYDLVPHLDDGRGQSREASVGSPSKARPVVSQVAGLTWM